MSKQPTWHEIALMLGERMRHHAYCHDHSLIDADPDNCPWCEDRKVFNLYMAKRRATERRSS